MNTSRLRETIEQLLQAENTTGFQGLLSEVNSHLSTLASQPKQPQHQTNFAGSLERLQAALSTRSDPFRPRRTGPLA